MKIKCQFCGKLKRYPEEISRESAHEVNKKQPEWMFLWRCKRCAGVGLDTYVTFVFTEDEETVNVPWYEGEALIERKHYKKTGEHKIRGIVYYTLIKPGKERIWRISE
jgi:hypothetical protein